MRRRDMILASTALMLLPAAAGAQAEPRSFPAPQRRVRANRVRSDLDPAVTIQLPRRARYLGAARWPLYDVADCEVHVFIEANRARQLKRLYWLQFEQALPEATNLRYDYNRPVNTRMTLWGKTWWRRARFGPTGDPPAAGSDLERVTAMILEAGYTLPQNIINVRFVRMLDDPEDTGAGRKELLLLYWEDMADVGAGLGDLITDNRPNERWTGIEGPLVERAASRFRLSFDAV
jgi:hypothetical protein